MGDAMLELRNVHASAGDAPILRGVDLVVRPGEVHAVSGNASATQPAKILAIVFTKKGDPVTIPGA